MGTPHHATQFAVAKFVYFRLLRNCAHFSRCSSPWQQPLRICNLFRMGSTALAEEGRSSEGSHRKAFLAAWLGWTFDGMDGFIYGLVAVPFVTELMGQGATLGEIAAMLYDSLSMVHT